MILHRLIAHHLQHKDDGTFYRLQARDALGWMTRQGVKFDRGTRVLDLGCGHGIFGAEIAKLGCHVIFADEANYLTEAVAPDAFRPINIDQDDLASLGTYDVVVCSNVFEHLAKPERFLTGVSCLMKTCGVLYLSWTNWLSPWGGHEFSPFHYLGPRLGPATYDRLVRKPRIHTPYRNLFPTSIGRTLKRIRQDPELRVVNVAPRYYPELAWVLKVPWLREFLAWNCALLLKKSPRHQQGGGACVAN